MGAAGGEYRCTAFCPRILEDRGDADGIPMAMTILQYVINNYGPRGQLEFGDGPSLQHSDQPAAWRSSNLPCSMRPRLRSYSFALRP